MTLALLAVGLTGFPVGCTAMSSIDGSLQAVTGSGATARELMLICRPKVLQMQDGSRAHGMVAQAYVMGGDTMGPIAVSNGQFHFTALDLSDGTPKLAESWSFPESETPRHEIEGNSLGTCYAFWLPFDSANEPGRKIAIVGHFQFDGRQIQSRPVSPARLVAAGS